MHNGHAVPPTASIAFSNKATAGRTKGHREMQKRLKNNQALLLCNINNLPSRLAYQYEF